MCRLTRSCISPPPKVVASPVPLTPAHGAPEKAKTQGFNGFLVFESVALASLSSGAIQNGFGWEVVNSTVLPFILLALAATFRLRLKRPVPAA